MFYTNYIRYKEFLKYLSVGIGVRPVGSNCCKLTGDYIKNTFKTQGLSVSTQDFNYLLDGENVTLTNVLGEIKAKNERKVLCFVAHYDTVPTSKGGIDNSSGVAVVMELAATIKEILNNKKSSSVYSEKINVELKQKLTSMNEETTFRFIALCGEEVGCVGSKAYLQYLSEEEKKKIVACYNFDMFMSYKTDDATLVVNTMGGVKGGEYQNGSDEQPFDNVISRCVNKTLARMQEDNIDKKYSDIWSPRNYGHSDHQTFHENFIESANVTIRGSKAINGKLPQGYHSDKDRYYEDTFDFEKSKYYLEVVLNSIMYLFD